MRRDWRDALAHHEGKGCRVCLRWPRELAHVIPRESDTVIDVDFAQDPRIRHQARRSSRGLIRVDPLAVVPLCDEHHRSYDTYRLDLMPYLKPEEWAHAVTVIGEGNARRRVQGGRVAA